MLAWIFGDCREGQIPRCLQRYKFDTPLLAAGSLIVVRKNRKIQEKSKNHRDRLRAKNTVPNGYPSNFVMIGVKASARL